jgi:hypothetical protein
VTSDIPSIIHLPLVEHLAHLLSSLNMALKEVWQVKQYVLWHQEGARYLAVDSVPQIGHLKIKYFGL